jgi:hypothetical protein
MRTKDAAVTRLRLERGAAAGALVEVNAGFGGISSSETCHQAGQLRLQIVIID